MNPPEAWIVREVPELRIIPDDLWDKVKARQAPVKRDTRPDLVSDRPFWERTRPKYLLSGLMKCGACSGSYTKISANLFGCAAARNKGTCSNRLNIRRETLEAAILDGLKHQLMDPDLFKAFVEEFTRELNRLSMSRSTQADMTKSKLARIEKQIDKLVTAIADGADALALNAKIKELEEHKRNAETELASSSEQSAPLLNPNMAELYRRKVATLTVLLEDPKAKDEVFETIRSMIDEVRLTPDKDQLRIDFTGELAGILDLCRKSKKPAKRAELMQSKLRWLRG